MTNTVVGYGKMLEPLEGVLMCLRVLFDRLIDLTFEFVYRNHNRRTLPPIEIRDESLLTSSAVELAAQIRGGEITSERLVKAFIRRIQEVNPILNSVVDQRFDAAVEEAKKADRIVKSLGENAKRFMLDELEKDAPFLGVPFAVDDNIRVKGLRQTCGLLERRDFVAPCDSDPVRKLRNAGAIPLCVTNSTASSNHWTNPVYGATKNPFDARKVSGGQSCLQAFAGVAIGVSEECQLSSAFCGLFSHKPSSPDVVEVRGCGVSDPPPHVGFGHKTVGPVCKESQDLLPLLKTLLSEERIDKLRLDEDVLLMKLRYFYIDCGIGNSIKVGCVNPEARQALFRAIDFLEDTFCVSFVKINTNKILKGLKTLQSNSNESVKNPQNRSISMFPSIVTRISASTCYLWGKFQAILNWFDAFKVKDVSSWPDRELLEEFKVSSLLLCIYQGNFISVINAHTEPFGRRWSNFESGVSTTGTISLPAVPAAIRLSLYPSFQCSRGSGDDRSDFSRLSRDADYDSSMSLKVDTQRSNSLFIYFACRLLRPR